MLQFALTHDVSLAVNQERLLKHWLYRNYIHIVNLKIFLLLYH